MIERNEFKKSQKWDSTTKTIAGLTIVALVSALLIYFRGFIGPLLVSFILAFVLYPLASWSKRTLKFSWKLSVNLIYLILVIFLVTLITVAGIAIIDQIGGLVNFFQHFVNQIPTLVEDISNRPFFVGPFQIDFLKLDLTELAQQLLNTIQPLLGQAGTLVSKFAASAATILGWTFLSILISYFFLVEAEQIQENIDKLNIPGFGGDIHRLIHELAIIWDTYLRGQLFISILIVFSYYIMLNILGTRLALAIALVAGLSRFVPYIGPIISWATAAIVAFLQTSNYFGLEPFNYMILVLAAFIILDQIFDYFIVPRFLGQSLGVHPGILLIVALIAANLIGIVGLVLAAPVLATVILISKYILRKMFDMEPWQESDKSPKLNIPPWTRLGEILRKVYLYIKRECNKVKKA